jgi:hypothetical protein
MKREHALLWSIFFIFILLTGLACAIPGFGGDTPPTAEGTNPQVTVSSPIAGQKLQPAQEVRIQSTSVDAEKGIVRVELLVDNEVLWVDANPDPQPNTPYIVAQPWTPEIPGSHLVLVRAFNIDNSVGQSEPVLVEVVVGAQSMADTPVTTPDNRTPTVAALLPLPTLTVTPLRLDSSSTPRPVCTPPPCRLDEGEVYYCAQNCPGGCGTTCATVTPVSTPTPTPTPGNFTPTGVKPEGRFEEIWQEVGGGKGRLGYPTGTAIIDRNFARQYFERGLMFWWDNPDDDADFIWAIDSPADDLKSGTAWNLYDDTWPGGDEFSCDEARANGNFGPIRGFGQVWCRHPELQTRLGNPRDYEGGSGGNAPFAHLQFFQGGVMIYNPLNAEVLVLFAQGDWQRFGY